MTDHFSEPATCYRIEMRGRLSDAILAAYRDDFTVSRRDDSTVLVGVVRDAAHLHGIISHITGLGIEVVSLAVTDP